MAREFFCEVMGQVFGPLEPAELLRMAKAGEITPTDKIRRGENGQWVEAAKVNGLFENRPSPSEPHTEPAPPPRARPPAPPPIVTFQPAPPTISPASVPSVPHAVPFQAVPYAPPTAVQVNVNTSRAAHSLGIGSVILGTLALFTICIPFIGLPLSAIGLCLGIAGIAMAAIRKGSGVGFSIAGTAVSSLVLLPGALFWYAFGSAMSTVSKEVSDAAAKARATNQVAVNASNHATNSDGSSANEMRPRKHPQRFGRMQETASGRETLKFALHRRGWTSWH